eukprot:CAMPEP_0183712950 /NCGR_PEP_ID=MMETSP0737-20130205/7979_1 /TAXON_ID=385413 /ORGANISM="Thalassiosira miniscula, Strain CCMP1093" /LENGTH=330 /DNA_ID=CAMNT_0025941689 /DNA_START=153 /DNA_END=1145 /DNA_ORIENTATION=+
MTPSTVTTNAGISRFAPPMLIMKAAVYMHNTMVMSISDQCSIDLREYSSSPSCLTGFTSQHLQKYSIIADGTCRDSGTEDLGYYVATCDGDTNWFAVSQSKCSDETCSECEETNPYFGMNQEGGCMINWSVSDVELPGSVPFTAIADGECHDSGIAGLGYYVASCQEDGTWVELSRSGCYDETCKQCTGATENKVDPFPATARTAGCEVDAFYIEQVWSISGSCQRSGCSGSFSMPSKWWPSDTSGKYLQCTYGNDYPEEYHLNKKLRDSLLFNSRGECCDAYARVKGCDPMASSAMPPNTINLENGSSICGQSLLMSVCIILLSGILLG